MNSQRILCVHKDASQLQELRGKLEQEGYEVVPAEDGSNAIDVLNTQGVDGVIFDSRLDTPGGVSLRSRLNHVWPDMPTLMFSEIEDVNSMPLNVFREYLKHPAPPESVLSKLLSKSNN